MNSPLPIAVPPELAARGIKGAASNLPPDRQVDIAGAFLRIFGNEAHAVLLAHQAGREDKHGA